MHRAIAFGLGTLCAAALLSANVGAAEYSDTALLIEVRNSDSSATMKVLFSDGTWDPAKETFSWDLSTAKTFKDAVTNSVIGTLKTCKLRVYGLSNCRINLDYAIEAGSSSTAFVITPGALSWHTPDGWSAEAKARASIYFQDKNGDGVSIRAPGKSGQSMYIADYNGVVPSGTQYTSLLGAVSGGPGSSGTVAQTDPAFGYRALADNPEDMSNVMRALVSPYDYCEISLRWNVHIYQP